MRDPYSVLGVKRDAGTDEIKTAWRTKAKSVHPDHNRDDPQASERFAEIGQAYDMLKDPRKRERYDQLRRAAEQKQRDQTIMQQRQEAREAAERAKASKANAEKVMEELARAEAARKTASAASAGNETAEDMIERIFGAQPQAQTSAQGKPKEKPQAAEAGPATTAEAPAATPQADPAPPEKAAPLPLPLQAVDLLASLVRRIRGTQPAPEKAPDITAEAMVTVAGILKHEWVTIPLPDGKDVRFMLDDGMTDGHVVRLKGQGLKLPNIPRGDLVVTLLVPRSGQFTVDGFDIHTILSLSLEDAVLGCETTVETPTGTAAVTVPPWSGSDRTIRIEGQGLPDGNGGSGDLVVELRIVLWEKPDEKITDLMRHMREGLFL